MEIKQDLNDKRTSVRLRFEVQATLVVDESGETFSGTSTDVSVSGLAIDSSVPEDFINRDCTVSLLFQGSSSNLVIQDVKGVIVRSDKKTAVSFVQPLEWFLLFPVYQKKLSKGASI